VNINLNYIRKGKNILISTNWELFFIENYKNLIFIFIDLIIRFGLNRSING
jgi:hypothetical protein